MGFLANSTLLLFSRYNDGPPPPPVTQAKLHEAIQIVSAGALQLGVAQERVLGLEQQLKDYKEWLKEAKQELKEARQEVKEAREKAREKAEEERRKGELAASIERTRGETAVARERERGEKQIRTLFDVRAFAGPNETRRSGFDSRRVVSG